MKELWGSTNWRRRTWGRRKLLQIPSSFLGSNTSKLSCHPVATSLSELWELERARGAIGQCCAAGCFPLLPTLVSTYAGPTGVPILRQPIQSLSCQNLAWLAQSANSHPLDGPTNRYIYAPRWRYNQTCISQARGRLAMAKQEIKGMISRFNYLGFCLCGRSNFLL